MKETKTEHFTADEDVPRKVAMAQRNQAARALRKAGWTVKCSTIGFSDLARVTDFVLEAERETPAAPQAPAFLHPTHPGRLPSIAEIEEATRRKESHFFDRETMRFFGQRRNMFRVKRSPAGRIFIYAPSYWPNHDGPGVRLMGYTFREFTGDDLAIVPHDRTDTLADVLGYIGTH